MRRHEKKAGSKLPAFSISPASMIAVYAAAMDVIESARRIVAVMVRVVAVPGMTGVAVVVESVAAPITVVERAVISVVIAVIIIDGDPGAFVAVIVSASAEQQHRAGRDNGHNSHLWLQILGTPPPSETPNMTKGCVPGSEYGAKTSGGQLPEAAKVACRGDVA